MKISKIFIFIIFLIIIISVHGNTSPRLRKVMKNVYLKEEEIKIYINNLDFAEVEAEYIMANDLKNDTTTEIIIPFFEKATDIKLVIDNVETNFEIFRKRYEHQDYIEKDHDDNWVDIKKSSYYLEGYVRDIEAIKFNLSFKPEKEIKINLKYKRKFYGYKTGLFKKVYFYTYITNTAIYWDKPIEKANFFFYIRKDLVKRFLNWNDIEKIWKRKWKNSDKRPHEILKNGTGSSISEDYSEGPSYNRIECINSIICTDLWQNDDQYVIFLQKGNWRPYYNVTVCWE
ncbi:MAG: hypothetical protein PHV06_07385 [bacterium]|nr:hypothetical protein [bacterium]